MRRTEHDNDYAADERHGCDDEVSHRVLAEMPDECIAELTGRNIHGSEGHKHEDGRTGDDDGTQDSARLQILSPDAGGATLSGARSWR